MYLIIGTVYILMTVQTDSIITVTPEEVHPRQRYAMLRSPVSARIAASYLIYTENYLSISAAATWQ